MYLKISSGKRPPSSLGPSVYWVYIERFSSEYFRKLCEGRGWGCGFHINTKMSYYHYKNSYYKDKTVSWSSYLYYGNAHTWKDLLYTEAGPWAPSQYQERRLFVRSLKDSKPRDWHFKLSYRFEIWQVHRQCLSNFGAIGQFWFLALFSLQPTIMVLTMQDKQILICHKMMTSSNGNIFRVTDLLCGEFTRHRWIPPQRPLTRSFDLFFDLRLNKRLSKQSMRWCFWTLSRPW